MAHIHVRIHAHAGVGEPSIQVAVRAAIKRKRIRSVSLAHPLRPRRGCGQHGHQLAHPQFLAWHRNVASGVLVPPCSASPFAVVWLAPRFVLAVLTISQQTLSQVSHLLLPSRRPVGAGWRSLADWLFAIFHMLAAPPLPPASVLARSLAIIFAKTFATIIVPRCYRIPTALTRLTFYSIVWRVFFSLLPAIF
jgi:hypothetical protein